MTNRSSKFLQLTLLVLTCFGLASHLTAETLVVTANLTGGYISDPNNIVDGPDSYCGNYETTFDCNPLYLYAPAGTVSEQWQSDAGTVIQNHQQPGTDVFYEDANGDLLVETAENASLDNPSPLTLIGIYANGVADEGSCAVAAAANFTNNGVATVCDQIAYDTPMTIGTVTYYSGANGTGTVLGSDTFQLVYDFPASTPEPATVALMGAGLIAIGIRRARKKS